MVRFGEKGTLRLVIEIDTPGAHAAYTHASPNAIRIAADLVRDLYGLEDLPVAQDDDDAPGHRGRVRRRSTRASATGASAILNKVTVSVGVIQGGVKINVLPGPLPARGRYPAAGRR